MKKLILITLVIVLVTALIFGGCAEPAPAPAPTPAPAPPAKEPTVLRLVSFKPDIPPANIFERMLVDKTKAKSNGELIIEWVGGPEAIPPPNTPAAVQSGAMEIVSSLYGEIDAMIPGWECLGFMTLTMAEFRKSEAWDIATNLAKEKNIHLLGLSTPCKPNRMAAFYSGTKIEKVEDFAGLKIATQGPAYAKFIEALGGMPAIIPMPDYFTAMERGTVDAFHVGVPGIIDWGCVDVTNYMIDETMGDCSSAYLVNLDVWNSLPKNQQDAMTEAAIEQENEGAEAWENIIAGVKEQASAAGVEIITFSPADEKRFYDIYMETVWGHVMQKNPELVAKFKEIVVP